VLNKIINKLITISVCNKICSRCDFKYRYPAKIMLASAVLVIKDDVSDTTLEEKDRISPAKRFLNVCKVVLPAGRSLQKVHIYVLKVSQ